MLDRQNLILDELKTTIQTVLDATNRREEREQKAAKRREEREQNAAFLIAGAILTGFCLLCFAIVKSK